MKPIYLSENHPRGFCSNMICLLGALHKYPDSEIVLFPPFMSLYAKDNSSGFFHYFQSKGRIRLASRSEMESEQTDPLAFGVVFPFPSHEENIASKGKLQTQKIFELSGVFSKEIEFQSIAIAAIVSKLKSNKTSNSNWTLAIHRRASDHSMHTDILAKDKFIKKIISHLNDHKGIFIATDEIGFVELCKKELENTNIFSNEVERTSGNVGIHFLPSNQSIRVQRGIDILADVVSIAKAKTLLCGASGIPAMAQILNPSLQIVDIVKAGWR